MSSQSTEFNARQLRLWDSEKACFDRIPGKWQILRPKSDVLITHSLVVEQGLFIRKAIHKHIWVNTIILPPNVSVLVCLYTYPRRNLPLPI